MKEITTIKLNNQEVHIFNYEMYIVDGGDDNYELNLDLVVSEIVAQKYDHEKEIDVAIIYKNGKKQNLKMNKYFITTFGNGEIPVLELNTRITNIEEYSDLRRFTSENEAYPNLANTISLEEIRKVEMPIEEVDLTLNLPIEQVEWIYGKEVKENINEILSEAIYDYWKKKNIKG